MGKLRLSVGEVRKAPNGNTYAFISLERTKGRVALLLIQRKNVASSEASLMSMAVETWVNWAIVGGENESKRISDEVRRDAYQLLHELPDPKYKK